MRVAKIIVSDECEHKDCSEIPVYAYTVTGDVGEDGVAVYCPYHADDYADPKDSHTAVGEVKA